MDSMNMTDSSSTSSNSSTTTSTTASMSMSMPMYLHFTPGDVLFFKTVAPSSAGAIFGACLIFFLVSFFARWFRSFRRSTEKRFTARARKLAFSHADTQHLFDQNSVTKGSDSAGQSVAAAPSSRFILSNELCRGALTGIEETLHYLLMLVVMTFNAGYIISVIFGAIVGEIAFGRLNHA